MGWGFLPDYITTHCPVCKTDTKSQIILVNNTIPHAVIGTFTFVYVQTTQCLTCNEKTNRYEFEANT